MKHTPITLCSGLAVLALAAAPVAARPALPVHAARAVRAMDPYMNIPQPGKGTKSGHSGTQTSKGGKKGRHHPKNGGRPKHGGQGTPNPGAWNRVQNRPM
ncbi:MAG: hypothetical protein JO250_10510 [Armatimonadetes bacterium]|nr:hypothetical protein [Armatimonadota bacterium]